MALITSISGIRGTIGGSESEGLNPLSIARFVVAYVQEIKAQTQKERPLVVIGRDARLSGEMVSHIVAGTLQAVGCDILDLGLATTPTTEMAVVGLQADGGIIITASHNPKHWNALKLLQRNGEFLSSQAGERIIARASNATSFQFALVDKLGKSHGKVDYLGRHIEAILALPEVDVDAISKADFSIAFDAINSVGAIALPRLFAALGVTKTFPINSEPTGDFAHNPEPLPEHLGQLCQTVRDHSLDMGIAVDPDVDRLAFIDELGEPFGEEYTLVAVADYLLSYHGGGNTVSNLSSSRALQWVTETKHQGSYTASAVGEVNVVERMKATNALIGGEGNGGVIVPALHYGRDALVGIALFLSFLAKERKSVRELRQTYPAYYMSKERVELSKPIPFAELLEGLKNLFEQAQINLEDGIKYDLPESWVHIRPSNTEPILRIYTEAYSQEEAIRLASEAKQKIVALLAK